MTDSRSSSVVSHRPSARRWLLRVRKAVMFCVAFGLLAAAWELYRLVGSDDGSSVFGWQVFPKANDRVMPSVVEIVGRFDDPLQRGSDTSIARFVAESVWYSLRLTLGGFVLGALFGIALAVVMCRFRVAERAVLPYLVVSQTVPLIALAPLVAGWGGKLSLFGWQWQRWTSVVVLGAFLTFFPVAVGTLRGLQSAPPAALELMDSYAAPWRTTLFRLRFPAALPYMIPALRLGAAGSVIGVVVAEISTGLRGGVGRPIIEFARQVTADPAKVYPALAGAAALGLLMAGLVALADVVLMRKRPPESA